MPDDPGNLPRWAVRVCELRARLRLNQSDFAAALKTKQNNVSRWESGQNKPSPDTFARMATLAEGVDKFFFLEAAGIPKELFMGTADDKLPAEMIAAAESVVARAVGGPSSKGSDDHVMIPVLADPVAAGNPLTVNEKDIAEVIPFPTRWLPPDSGMIFGVIVEGDSMSPVMHEGDVALVDVSKRDVKKLLNGTVAVRVGDGVTIKYLRKSGKLYQLVPQNTSLRHEIRIVGEDDDWSIVGEVVKVVTTPPPPRRK